VFILRLQSRSPKRGTLALSNAWAIGNANGRGRRAALSPRSASNRRVRVAGVAANQHDRDVDRHASWRALLSRLMGCTVLVDGPHGCADLSNFPRAIELLEPEEHVAPFAARLSIEAGRRQRADAPDRSSSLRGLEGDLHV